MGAFNLLQDVGGLGGPDEGPWGSRCGDRCIRRWQLSLKVLVRCGFGTISSAVPNVGPRVFQFALKLLF